MNIRALSCTLAIVSIISGSSRADSNESGSIPELQSLDKRYEARFAAEVNAPFEKMVAGLKAHYAAALERERDVAQKQGKLEEALALRTEQETVTGGKRLAPAEAEDTPAVVKGMRQTYWNAYQRLDSERNSKYRVVARAYGEELDQLKVRLTQQGRLDEAKDVAAKKSSLERGENSDAKSNTSENNRVGGASVDFRNPPKLAPMTKATFERALQTGGGKTHWAIDPSGNVTAGSSNPKFPDMLVFGAEADGGAIIATMRNNNDPRMLGQGLALCVTRENKVGEGYNGSPAFYVRCHNGRVDLFDAVPFGENAAAPNLLATSPVDLGEDALYEMTARVQQGSKVTVAINGKVVMIYTAARSLRGRYALAAGNGPYHFDALRTDANMNKAVR